MFAPIRQKRLSANQLNGQRGELLVNERVLAMGMSFQGFNRLETGIDGVIELRDPQTEATLGKWVAVQVKTTHKDAYSYETDAAFQYLLDPSDLAYWRNANLPVIIVLVRLSDSSMYWKSVGRGLIDEPRRLMFDKTADAFAPSAADIIAALAIDKNTLGTYAPPMMAGETLHLNLVRLILPDEIFVARTPFAHSRQAIAAMLARPGPRFFDWVVRDGTYWSFRDPRIAPLSEIVDLGTIEAVETEAVSQLEEPADEAAFIDLLRRSVEAQLRNDLAFDKDSRTLFFRAEAPGRPRTYTYRSLQNETSADVVTIMEKEGRDVVMRHHAFLPRYQKIGRDWHVSIQPTFVFTSNGYRPHPIGSLLLAGKKKLEKNGAVRGQFLMWRHLLIQSGEPATDLLSFNEPQDPRPRIGFAALEGIQMPISVPEEAWRNEAPEDFEDTEDGLL